MSDTPAPAAPPPRKTFPGVERATAFASLLFAGLIYAAALKYFVLPSKVILTGSEGIAAALSYYFESYALFIGLYVVFQLALLSFAWLKVGRLFAVRSVVVVATVVVALALLPELQVADPEPRAERIILVIFGGLLAGVAKAIAFKRRGSTGDEDILGAYFAVKYLRPVGSIVIIAAVVSTAFGLGTDLLKTGQFASAINTLMYTCLYIFISAETLNNLYHKFQLTMFAIVTRRPDEVGGAIRAASEHRTYTVQAGVGGHSGAAFSMLRTIVTREELPAIRRAVEEADPGCFYYHHDIEGVSSRYYITPIG
jgi:uncharacterized membrane-anchored protein YitT (DUF2179 family)